MHDSFLTTKGSYHGVFRARGEHTTERTQLNLQQQTKSPTTHRVSYFCVPHTTSTPHHIRATFCRQKPVKLSSKENSTSPKLFSNFHPSHHFLLKANSIQPCTPLHFLRPPPILPTRKKVTVPFMTSRHQRQIDAVVRNLLCQPLVKQEYSYGDYLHRSNSCCPTTTVSAHGRAKEDLQQVGHGVHSHLETDGLKQSDDGITKLFYLFWHLMPENSTDVFLSFSKMSGPFPNIRKHLSVQQTNSFDGQKLST